MVNFVRRCSFRWHNLNGRCHKAIFFLVEHQMAIFGCVTPFNMAEEERSLGGTWLPPIFDTSSFVVRRHTCISCRISLFSLTLSNTPARKDSLYWLRYSGRLTLFQTKHVINTILLGLHVDRWLPKFKRNSLPPSPRYEHRLFGSRRRRQKSPLKHRRLLY